jgi:hypothetical protein
MTPLNLTMPPFTYSVCVGSNAVTPRQQSDSTILRNYLYNAIMHEETTSVSYGRSVVFPDMLVVKVFSQLKVPFSGMLNGTCM